MPFKLGIAYEVTHVPDVWGVYHVYWRYIPLGHWFRACAGSLESFIMALEHVPRTMSVDPVRPVTCLWCVATGLCAI